MPTIVVDAHQDIAYNALCFGRDYRRSVYETRRAETAEIVAEAGVATLGLPNALLGRVAVVFATLFTSPVTPQPMPWDKLRYKTPREAYERAMLQLDYYNRLVDQTDQVTLIRTGAELDAVLATWADDADPAKRKQGLVLLMENADPILEPRQFEEWYARGVRLVGPAWSATRYAGGTQQPGPLTDLGRELLDVMANFNAVLDLSHLAEDAYLEAVDRYPGVIIASHSNPRRFSNTDRHLSDEMIRRLAERGGVMGIVAYNRFLSSTWVKGDRKSDIPLATYLDAIDYVCQVTGSAAHVGIGTDLDGGFGAESTPDGIDTVTDLWAVGEGLASRGYSPADVQAVLSGNMLRQLRRALP